MPTTPEPGVWEGYWRTQPATLTARTMSHLMDRVKADYLRAILPARSRILEVGCGSARLSCLLARSGHRTQGLDFCRAALDAARANCAGAGVQAALVLGEGSRLPFRGGTLDVVLSTGLLEHFEDPLPIVREMVRVLRAGGVFYSDIVPRKFSLFRSLDWLGRLKRRWAGRGRESEDLYERSCTKREIAALLEACGLRGIHVFAAGVTPPYLPILSRSRRLRETQVRLVEGTSRFWKRFDGTRCAEWLGFYYVAWGIKP